MKRIGDVTPTANKQGEFTNGNPATATPATTLEAEWLNMLQRELLNVLKKSGVEVNPEDDGQLAQAIVKMAAPDTATPTDITNGTAGKLVDAKGLKVGLGNSATLNKTDVLGTSVSLVATQKLVNDTKINLENSINSKQDKLTFTGTGNVARMSEVDNKITGGSVVQSTGTSTTNVMSQKAVTDKLNSIESSHGLGYGQTWVDVTRERAKWTVYQNTTGKPIAVYLDSNAVGDCFMYVSNTADGGWVKVGNTTGKAGVPNSFIVPVNAYYKVEAFLYWSELR